MAGSSDLLATSLEAAVPLWINEFRGLPEDERMELIAEISDGFAERMEALVHRAPGKTAGAFNDLARAIALMSFMPGGVKCFGQHWESKSD